jgi:hypothetical protein
VVSALAPIPGFVCPYVFAYFAQDHLPWQVLLSIGLWFLLGVTGLGLLAAVAATVRRERLWGITAVGYFVNVVPFLITGWVLLAGP